MDLPNNLDVEKQVLANMIFSKDVLIETMTRLNSEDFYYEPHQIIFQTLINIFKQENVKIEPSVLIDRLSIENNLEKIGDANYIIELCDSFIDISNAQYYINAVQERSILRNLIILCNKVVTNWKTELSDLDVADYINKIEKETLEVTKKRKIENFVKMDQALKQYALRTQDILSGKDNFEGILCSSIPTLNKMTLGFHPGELIILAARPGEGKSALALNLLVEGIERSKKVGVMFSLEMPVLQLTQRMLASKSGVDLRKIQTASFNREEEARVSSAIRKLQDLRIFIDETPRAKVIDMRAKLQKLQSAEGDIGFIVVDYLGLIAPDFPTRGISNRVLELGEITANLRAIAKDFNAPILVLAQLNRNAEQDSKNSEPKLSNLRESGAIEQDADVVLFIQKLELKDKPSTSTNPNENTKNQQQNNSESTNASSQKDSNATANTNKDAKEKNVITAVNLIIAKQRNGSTGKIPVRFVKNLGRFIEYDKDASLLNIENVEE